MSPAKKAEGWILVQDRYEDAGYSGGNTERPALKRLMADIEAGEVDVVATYKLDRLTRSLPDFVESVDSQLREAPPVLALSGT